MHCTKDKYVLTLPSFKEMGVLRWATRRSDDGLHELTSFCVNSDSVEDSLVRLQQALSTLKFFHHLPSINQLIHFRQY